MHVTSLGVTFEYSIYHKDTLQWHLSTYIVTWMHYRDTWVQLPSPRGTTLTPWVHSPSLGGITMTLEYIYNHKYTLEWHLSAWTFLLMHYSYNWLYLQSIVGTKMTLECMHCHLTRRCYSNTWLQLSSLRALHIRFRTCINSRMHYIDIGEDTSSLKTTAVTREHMYFTMGSTVIFMYIYYH